MNKKETRPAEELLAELVNLLQKLSYLVNQKPVERELYYDNASMKQVFNLSDSTLYRLRKEGQLPFCTINRKFYYSKEKVHQLLDVQMEYRKESPQKP